MTDQAPATTETESARKTRHDAFDGKRKRAFLDALGKCGCLRDAARRAGVSHQTVYNHQARDSQFARQCELALDMASTDIELHAWERGVVGVEEPIVRNGEIVGTRLKRSDAILRLLLQATKRKKYGPNPGFTRKQLTKFERQKIEREVRIELDAYPRAAKAATQEEVDRELMFRLDELGKGINAQRLRDGWTKIDEENWVPPGWVRADAQAEVPAALAWPGNRAEPRIDFV